MNKLYLVRHGEDLSNITKQFSFRLVDYSLTEKGILQARQTAEYFRDRDIHEIYSSPLKRAYETAQIIADALSLPVTVVENLREVNVGSLEEQPPTLENWRLLVGVFMEWRKGNLEACAPGGENCLMLRERARGGIRQVVQGKVGRNIVVVGHGGLFITLVTDICRNTTPDQLPGDYHNCSISEVDVTSRDGELEGHLLGWGLCSHLSGEAADFVFPLPEALRQG